MTNQKQEPRAVLLARMDERLKNVDKKQETLIQEVQDLRVQLGDLTKWQATIKGGWRAVIVGSGLLAFGISMAVAFLTK